MQRLENLENYGLVTFARLPIARATFARVSYARVCLMLGETYDRVFMYNYNGNKSYGFQDILSRYNEFNKNKSFS